MTYPNIKIKSHMYPGYGSARGGYHVRAVYKNTVLEDEHGGESLEAMGYAVAKMEARWLRLSASELEEASKGKPLDSPLCSNCGQPCYEGSCSCLDKTWCDRPACRHALEVAIVASKEAAATQRAEFAERQAQDHLDRIKHADAVATGFHWREGWYFRRLPDGSVGIVHRETPTSEWLRADLIIPPNEWASIVASMSNAGETAKTFRAAHDAQKPQVDTYIRVHH